MQDSLPDIQQRQQQLIYRVYQVMAAALQAMRGSHELGLQGAMQARELLRLLERPPRSDWRQGGGEP